MFPLLALTGNLVRDGPVDGQTGEFLRFIRLYTQSNVYSPVPRIGSGDLKLSMDLLLARSVN